MSDTQCIINIHGGNNQILPQATQATQYFYGNELAEKLAHNPRTSPAPQQENHEEAEAAKALLLYIDGDRLGTYVARLRQCLSAAEVAKVVIDMYLHEVRLSQEDVVKERFIRHLLPLITGIAKGTSIDNLRVHINNELARLPRDKRCFGKPIQTALKG